MKTNFFVVFDDYIDVLQSPSTTKPARNNFRIKKFLDIQYIPFIKKMLLFKLDDLIETSKLNFYFLRSSQSQFTLLSYCHIFHT